MKKSILAMLKFSMEQRQRRPTRGANSITLPRAKLSPILAPGFHAIHQPV
jgi:hypothetical protein